MGRHLLVLKEREGWRALGYPNWTAMLESDAFYFSRNYLYELMRAAPVIERLHAVAHISGKAALVLAKFDTDLQPVIVKTAIARYGKVTESNIARVGAVFQEVTTTGHVDTGNGTSTPIDAALNLEDMEAALRAKQYLADKSKRVRVTELLVRCEFSQNRTTLFVRGGEPVGMANGKIYTVVVYEEKENEDTTPPQDTDDEHLAQIHRKLKFDNLMRSSRDDKETEL